MSQDLGQNVDAFIPDAKPIGAPEILARHGSKKLKHIKLKTKAYEGAEAASQMSK